MNLRSLARVACVAAAFAAPTILSAQSSQKGKNMKDIVAVAAGAGQFNTLVAALKAAGLVETLQGPGPFTVFAPTDAAFAKLPKGAIEALLADREKLAAVLTYHVIPAKVAVADIRNMGGGEVTTVNGAPVNITLDDGNVFVDGAKVINADIQASNGVIHVISSVILPSMAPVGAGK
jgi:uncharacterized surface protein with fasciclin (FAS1) repeats